MTYSKIINIETKLLNINYDFQFSKPFKFRFLTKENLKGIELDEPKLEEINNTTVGKNNWYLYNADIDFSPLSKYKFLILQLYSDEIVNEDIKLTNDINNNFFITNKNTWYNCKDFGADCGLIVKDLVIDSYKAVQEVDNNLIYTIDGNATLIKFKYLKTGKTDSTITVSGVKPNIINYIGKFTLYAKDKKINNGKNPISVNKYSQFIDNIIFSQSSSDNKEINSINSRIEMIKFQLKNYFIENDKQLDTIESNIESNNIQVNNKIKTEVDDINDQITSLDSQAKLLESKVTTLQDKLNESNLDEFLDNEKLIKEEVSRLEKSINQIMENNKLIETKVNESTTSNIQYQKDVNDKLETVSTKLKNINLKLENVNTRIDNSNKEDADKFNDISEKINDIRLKLDELSSASHTHTIDDDTGNIWSNYKNNVYEIEYHKSILNLKFITEEETYKVQGLYLIKDCTKLVVPYFCSTIKIISSTASTARLIPLSSINNYY